MATPVLMPQQGNTVEECLLVAWKKKKGDPLEKGEILAEIETDKATFELEAPASGTLLETFVSEGELAPVLTHIAVIGSPGEPVEAFRPVKGSPASIEKARESFAPIDPLPESGAVSSQEGARPSPRARAFLHAHPVDLSGVQGSGAGGRIMEQDVRNAWNRGARPSPLSAELMRKNARPPKAGSGPGGLIRSEDLSEPGKPLSGIRAIIAQRMCDSLFSTAQYTVSVQAEAEGLLELRKRVKARFSKEGGDDITLGDMVMFACVVTLKAFRELNAEFVEGVLYLHKNIHLGFACDTPKGLLVPVIKNCNELSLPELSRRAKTLAQKAVEGKISPDDLSGGTFTVSNLGSFGITSFTPVINTPQVAILGVCAITPQPMRKEGRIDFVDQIGFSLTADHQVVDGAAAARFLKALGENIKGIQAIAGLKL
jgi:pyruvate dehydrogenase E2 component (dihydrolipoamide acetyltransferase)